MATGQTLRALLAPFLTPDSDVASCFRFHDAPPAVIDQALDLLSPNCRLGRPNGQPPAGWLIDVAEKLGGTLAGLAAVGDELGDRIRVDAVCVPGEHGADLARAVARDWPEPEFGEQVLDLALAEGWTSWQSAEPCWTGSGSELISPEPRAAVVGLWWD
jgi:hypothetical protein